MSYKRELRDLQIELVKLQLDEKMVFEFDEACLHDAGLPRKRCKKK